MSGSPAPTLIVCGPAPGILNSIVSAPGLRLASRIAARSEPGVGLLLSRLSAAVVTTKVITDGDMMNVRDLVPDLNSLPAVRFTRCDGVLLTETRALMKPEA